MREYTAKEIKLLKANLYTFNVTKNKLYFTAEFKQGQDEYGECIGYFTGMQQQAFKLQTA